MCLRHASGSREILERFPLARHGSSLAIAQNALARLAATWKANLRTAPRLKQARQSGRCLLARVILYCRRKRNVVRNESVAAKATDFRHLLTARQRLARATWVRAAK